MTSEARLIRLIELAIGALPGVLCLRNSVGVTKEYDPDTGLARVISYGLSKGSPDLLVFLRDDARGVASVVALEVKTDVGRLSPDQVRCHVVWRQAGVRVFVVRSAEQARAAIEEARVR